MLDHIRKHQESIANNITKSYSSTSQVLSQDDLEKSATEYFEKGRKAAIGEQREFGGRNYIKTVEGWKFHGKGTGTKAQTHVASALNHHVNQTNPMFHKDLANEAKGSGKTQKDASGQTAKERDKEKNVIADPEGDEKTYLDRVSEKGKSPKTTSATLQDDLSDDYASGLSDKDLNERLSFYQTKEKEFKAEKERTKQGGTFKHHSRVRSLEREWSKRNSAKK